MKTVAETQFAPPPFSHNGKISRDDIAFAAFCLWEQEGRPNGRDLAHWFRAENLLQEAHKAAAPRAD